MSEKQGKPPTEPVKQDATESDEETDLEVELARVDRFFDNNERLAAFFSKNQVDMSVYKQLLVEYVRDGRRSIRLRSTGSFLLDLLAKEVKRYEVHPIFKEIWLLPKRDKINKLSSYEDGLICGIEASSAIVVKCLGVSNGDVVLDLCCSPGAKLLYICDLYKGLSPSGYSSKVFGNDISEQRSKICKSLLRKYGHEDIE